MQGKTSIFLEELKSFFKMFLPRKNTELIIFLLLLAFYLSYSLFIVFRTSIIDPLHIESDLYFSFDNPLILKYGRTQIAGHPLIVFFYYPFVIIGNFLATLIGYKAKTVFFVLLSASMISMSAVYIYRYFKEIIELKKDICLILTVFFAFLSTNLILAFTPESFTLSTFFLTFTVYYYSHYIKQGKSPSFTSSVILADICLGGVTITNVVKGAIPILFLNQKWTTIIKKLVLLGLVFIGILCLIQLGCSLFLNKDFFGAVFTHRETWTPGEQLSGLAYWETVFSHFFGGPLFFPELGSYSYHDNASNIDGVMISDELYRYWWQFLFVAALLIFIVVAFVKNYKNKFVQMLFLLFAFDIFIHCVMRFGLFGPFIYGAHWIYCIPLLLGWLYKSFEARYSKISLIVFSCMLAALVINNSIRMSDFVQLAIKLYPVGQ